VQEFATSLGLSVNEAKALISVVVLVAYLLIRWLALRIVHRRVKDEEVWYRTRKIVTYAAFILIVLSLVRIWVVPFGDLATFLGLVSAGVAVALADVLKDIVGWAYILSRRPFRVGDRIETEDFSGDVIDIRLFRFTMMEIGNWVYGDHSTGRIVHLPNQLVFTTPIANYTEGFGFIWHEVPVLVTFESDWKKAEVIIRGIIDEAAPEVAGAALGQLRKTAQAYRIKYGQMTPTVYVSGQESGVQLTARLLVPVRRRRDINQKIWRSVLEAFAAEPSIDLAYPTVRTYLQGPIRVDNRPEGAG
jgi:small-conductance mechanosensitive channel